MKAIADCSLIAFYRIGMCLSPIVLQSKRVKDKEKGSPGQLFILTLQTNKDKPNMPNTTLDVEHKLRDIVRKPKHRKRQIQKALDPNELERVALGQSWSLGCNR